MTISIAENRRPQDPATQLNMLAVVNTHSGTVLGLSQDLIRTTVTNAFTRVGHRISVEFIPPYKIEAAVARAANSDARVVLVGGGDGTVSTAARHLVGTGKVLGILPLGTMNRLAKDLGIPLQLEAAAETLATATVAKIDVATVNDHIFLCNSVMGTTVGYSVGRARLRGRPLPERLSKFWAIVREVLSSRRKISIAVDNGSERMRLRALSVVVTNNSYDEQMPWLKRPRLDKGHLTMYVSKHQSGWGMARALVRAVLGRWRGDANVSVLKGSEFVIHSPRKRKRLANDGEVSKFPTPLRYAIDQRALHVLVPRAEPRTPN